MVWKFKKKVGLIGCPKMSVPTYQPTLHNVPEENRPQLQWSGNLKSRTCDVDYTGRPRRSRMGVNTAQMDGLIVEADMWDVTSLTSMGQWIWLLLNKRAQFLPGGNFKVCAKMAHMHQFAKGLCRILMILPWNR
jgi:hypothetical protein